MFEKLYFDKESALIKPFMAGGVIYTILMGIYACISYLVSMLMIVMVIVLEMSLDLGALVELTAVLFEIIACCLMVVGFFIIKKTRILFALGWLCYALQVLIGSIILPLCSDIYGDPYPIYLPLLHILLTAVCTYIGVCILIGRGNRWLIAGCAVLVEGLFLLTLILGSNNIVGTIGTHMWLYSLNPFKAVCLIASISVMCVSTVLAGLMHKPMYY